jgi:hypothetical protein
VAVLGWNGPYDSHEANSIAKTSLTKVFIEAFLGAPKQIMKIAPEIQAQILGVGFRETQLDLDLIGFYYDRIKATD